ncbi:hypothetical protein RB195_009499 [Necator americanus]|uniref:Secreted protein n=1 Tax=Necator americanus TaxID=51031 RepID=A0ABR1CV63_NECAM
MFSRQKWKILLTLKHFLFEISLSINCSNERQSLLNKNTPIAPGKFLHIIEIVPRRQNETFSTPALRIQSR